MRFRNHCSHLPTHPFFLRLFKRPWQWLLMVLAAMPLAWAAGGVSINNLVITTIKQLSFAQARAEVGVNQQFTQTATVRLSPGAVTYRSSDTAVATVNAQTGQVSGVLAGEATITADQAAAAPYPAASASYTIKVKGQAVAFGAWQLDPVVFGVQPFTIKPLTSNSPGKITYSVDSNSASVLSITPDGLITVKAAGEATITATQAPAGVFDKGTAQAVLKVTGATPRFTWPNQAVSLGSTLNLVPPTDSPSAGAFRFAVQDTAIATVNGTVVTPKALGTTWIQVTQEKSGSYEQTSLLASLTVVAGNVSSVSLVLPPNPAYGTSFKPQTSTNSDGAITLVSLTPSVAQIDRTGTQVQIVGVGPATIEARVSKTNSFPAASTSASLTAVKADPYLNMNDLSRLAASAAFELPLSTRSDGALSATSSATSVALIEPALAPSKIPRIAPQNMVGTTTLTIQQQETNFYKSATLSRTLELTGNIPKITWPVPRYIYAPRETVITLPPATSESSGALSYSVSFGESAQWAMLNGLNLSLTGSRNSTLTLTVTQQAAPGFTSATFSVPVTVSYTEAAPALSPTYLVVDTSRSHKLGDGAFRLDTRSNSTAAIQLQYVTGPIRIVSGPIENGQPTMLVEPVKEGPAGLAKVRVFQEANATHTAASVEADLLITSDTAPITGYKPAPIVLDDTQPRVPVPRPDSNSSGAFTFSVENSGIAEVDGTQLKLKQAGTTRIRVEQAADYIYGADSAVGDLIVLHQPSNLAFPQAPLPRMYTSSPRLFSIHATSRSPQAVTYSSTNPGVATISSDGTVSLTGVAGSTTFIAEQTSTHWYAAGRATTTLTVVAASDSGLRLAGFSVPLSAGSVAVPYQTQATDRPVVVSVSDASYASVDPANPQRLILHKAGEVLVTVKHPATATLPEATASAFLTITPAVPVLTGLPSEIRHVWTGTSPPPTTLQPAPAGNYRVTTSNANVASVNSMQVTLTGVGDAYLVVTRSADASGPEVSATIPVRVSATQEPTTARLPLLALKNQVLDSTTRKVQLQAVSDSPAKIIYSVVNANPAGFATLSEQGELLVSGPGTMTVRASQEAVAPNFLANSVNATITVSYGKMLFEVTSLPAQARPGEVIEYRYRTNDPQGDFEPDVRPGELKMLSYTKPATADDEGVVYFKVNEKVVKEEVWIGVNFFGASFLGQQIFVGPSNLKFESPARSLKIVANGAGAYSGLRLRGPVEWLLNDPRYGGSNQGLFLPPIVDQANNVVGRCQTYVSSNPSVADPKPNGTEVLLAFYSVGQTTLSCQEDPSLSTQVIVRGQDPQLGAFPPYELSMDSAPVTLVPPTSTNSLGAWTYEVVRNVGVSGGAAIALVDGRIEPRSEGQAVIRATQAGAAQYNGKSIETTVTVKPSQIKGFTSVTVTYGDKDFTMPRPDTADTITPIGYSISDPQVATIDASSALVKIVGAGTATVTARQGSQSLTTTLTVLKALPRLSFLLADGLYLQFSGCYMTALRWPRANVPGYPGEPTGESVPGAALSTNSDGQLSYASDLPLLGWADGDNYPLGIKRAADSIAGGVFRGTRQENALRFNVWVHQAESRNFFSATSPAQDFHAFTNEGVHWNGDPTQPLVYNCRPNP